MRKQQAAFVISICTLISATYFSAAFAQETILNNIKERRQERRQDLVDKLSGNISSPGEHPFFIEHDGLIREYKVYVPKKYSRHTATALVVFLHGGGGSMNEAFSEGMDKMSEKYGFLLAIPQGTGEKILGKTIGSWNCGNWSESKKINPISCCGYAGHNNIDDVGFISKMLDKIANNFSVDRKRIYVTGISNGAMMSYRLAYKLDNKIAAVAVVAPPFVPEVCSGISKPVSVMHTHGTADPCALYEGGFCPNCLGKPIYSQSAKNMVNFWITKDKCSGEPRVVYGKGNTQCVRYSECAQKTEVEFCTIAGGGHTWPSGNQYMPVEKIGPVSNDMSFDQMWEFFEKHTLNN